jgi:hypothetical protein
MREKNITFGLLHLVNFTKGMFHSSIHLPVNDKTSFFIVTEQNSIEYQYHIFLIQWGILTASIA